jgi:hypothetical protein
MRPANMDALRFFAGKSFLAETQRQKPEPLGLCPCQVCRNVTIDHKSSLLNDFGFSKLSFMKCDDKTMIK